MATSKKAGAAKAVQVANTFALDFNERTVAGLFKAISDKRSIIDAADGEARDASAALVIEAHRVAADAAERGADGDTIMRGWSAEVRALMPMLAADGVTFVEESEKKPGQFRMTGYGQNVNSTARGFCEFPELNPEDARAEDGTLSYRSLAALVAAKRAESATDEEKALKAAKESLADSIKAFRKSVTAKGATADSIIEAAAMLDMLTAELTAEPEVEVAEPEQADAEAEAA
jgi:hypothetical protein